MKKSVYLMTVIALLVFVWSASSSASDKADKIGFVNLQKIIQNSKAGKKDADDFKKFYEKKTQEIRSSEKELKTMKDELDKQSDIMTQSARSEKESAYQKKLRDYQFLAKDTNEELRQRDQEMTQQLMPGIIKSVRSIAEKGKYALVIDVATMPIPYYAKGNDITDKVIEEYNKASK